MCAPGLVSISVGSSVPVAGAAGDYVAGKARCYRLADSFADPLADPIADPFGNLFGNPVAYVRAIHLADSPHPFAAPLPP
jgi:hypothetical protein